MTETVRSFKAKLAAVLTKLADEESFRRTDASRVADYLGLPRPVSKGTTWEIPQVPEEEYVDGKPRSAYTDAFLAEYENKALNTLRRQAYIRLQREMCDYDMPADIVEGILSGLGLPVPQKMTYVRATVRGIPGDVNFTLDGEHSKDEIIALLEPQAIDPLADAVRAAFPDVKALRPKVAVSVVTELAWPEVQDI